MSSAVFAFCAMAIAAPRIRAGLLATRTGVREILTANRRDFAVYRLAGRARFLDVPADG